MKPYRCVEIGLLAHELALSPARHRLRQINGAAHAIDLIDPAREYPYSFVCFHITGYRPRHTQESLLNGRDLILDLVRLLDELTAGHPIPSAAAGQRLYDVEAMARRFKVSTKTIGRWRARGLVGCWYQFEDGKARFAASERSLQRFASRNIELVRRGAAFQVMTAVEKQQIVLRARELVSLGRCSLHAITLKLAEETGRCVETIRYTLRRHDDECPDRALFDRFEKPQPVDQDRVLFDAFADGESVKSLASRFGRSESDVRRTVTSIRAADLIGQPIAYMYNAEFDAPGAERTILSEPAAAGTDPEDDADGVHQRVPANVPPYLADLYRIPLLSRDEEYDLFRRMNFLRHLAESARQRLGTDARAVRPDAIARVDDLLDRAAAIKNRIVQANLRLVVSIAKRHVRGPHAGDLFELISDGNLALMRAVDKFDYARGFRFSTYASWAISRHYARSIPEELARADRFQTGNEERIGWARDLRGESSDSASAASDRIRSVLSGSLSLLEDRERDILERHYGLHDGSTGQTLDQIGRALGISKERVRQIELRALTKLRSSLGERGAELLAG